MPLREFAQSPTFGLRAELWADRLYFGLPGQPQSFPVSTSVGINGVAIFRKPADDDYIALLAPAPKTFHETRLDESPLFAPQEFPGLPELVGQVLPGESFDRVGVMYVPDLSINLNAGAVVVGAMAGTAGPGVVWANGCNGFLTAGHVAINVLKVTDQHGTLAGNTVHVFDPAHPSAWATPNVDVALIQVTRGAKITRFSAANVPAYSIFGVDFHLSSMSSSNILAKIGWYVWPSSGTYIDLYMTGGACTQPGDSGGAVTLSGTSELIGMVVGGTKTFASFVQDIATQLAALRTVTGLNSIAL